MKLLKRLCSICGNDNERVWMAANIDEEKLNDFSFSSRKLPEYMNFRMLHCQYCDVIYANPIPPMDWIQNAYEEASYDSDREARFAATTYARILRPFLHQLPDRKGSLDIGTGNGAFLDNLLDMDFQDVAGVEPSIKAIACASNKVKALIQSGLFDSNNFEKESLSLVSCFHTIEHLEDPLGFCESAKHLLKKGGILYLAGHNYQSFVARVMGRRSPIYDVEHLQIHSPESLTFMLEKLGFSKVQTFSYFNTYPLYYWVKLFPLPEYLKAFMLKSLEVTTLGRLPIPIPAGNQVAIAFKD